ncbi:hypothetical protein CVT24_002798 [Panaeolus cyanescens]|uniref:Uncharacterized protein n=1 Tax=Panaeolus cyanescens TaxID=181874 RepID=A0A409WCD3_9AGAR|nr:hypothetical protein CVT24_002798 [Panaeolus cyanescens]
MPRQVSSSSFSARKANVDEVPQQLRWVKFDGVWSLVKGVKLKNHDMRVSLRRQLAMVDEVEIDSAEALSSDLASFIECVDAGKVKSLSVCVPSLALRAFSVPSDVELVSAAYADGPSASLETLTALEQLKVKGSITFFARQLRNLDSPNLNDYDTFHTIYHNIHWVASLINTLPESRPGSEPKLSLVVAFKIGNITELEHLAMIDFMPLMIALYAKQRWGFKDAKVDLIIRSCQERRWKHDAIYAKVMENETLRMASRKVRVRVVFMCEHGDGDVEVDDDAGVM